MLQPPIGQLQPAGQANVVVLPNLLTPSQEAPLAPVPGADAAYAAYQAGFYITAAHEAIKRVKAGDDPRRHDPAGRTLCARLRRPL